jgi:hypothetical protein
MTKLLLSIHVLAVILAIGPVTIAGSMLPRFARLALAAPGDQGAAAIVRTLHRICRVYAVVGIFVPAFGIATALSLGVLTDTWLLVAIGLTAIAAVLLVASLLPQQRAILARVEAATPGLPTPPQSEIRRLTARLGMTTGVFSLLWAVVTVLMIVRPGSTTGA